MCVTCELLVLPFSPPTLEARVCETVRAFRTGVIAGARPYEHQHHEVPPTPSHRSE